MRRRLAGIGLWVAVGMAVGSAAHGQEEKLFTEVQMQTVRGTPFTLPKEFGKLVNVVSDSEVQYLYFEDRTGNLRVVLTGPRGAVSRARSSLQLLTTDVVLIKRERPAAE